MRGHGGYNRLPMPAPSSGRSVPVLVRVALFWGALAAVLVASAALGPALQRPAARTLFGLALSALALGLTRLAQRGTGRTLADDGLAVRRGSAVRLGLGFLLGLGLFALELGILRAFGGGVTLVRVPEVGLADAATMGAMFLALSAMEETAFRGYPLRALDARHGRLVAQLAVALAFALYHRAFAGYGWQEALVGTTLGSFLFASAAFASGGLALPIGLHAAWNCASWAVGDKPQPGPWRVEVAAEAAQTVRVLGSCLYVGLFVLAALGFGLRERGRRAAGGDPGRGSR